ncbi:MAG: pentapeptide repeat-containing protein [Cyanobacteria bacterium J06626_18]
MQELENAYRVLDLEPGASLEDINQSYKDLVFIWHPDRLPKDNTRLIEKAQEKIKQLNQARDYLRTHARNTERSPSSPSYRSRTRPYGRAYQHSGYRQRPTENDAAEAANRRTYTNPYQTYQSRYAQSSYGTYGAYRGTNSGASSSNGRPRADAQSPSNTNGNSNSNGNGYRSYSPGAQGSHTRAASGANPSTVEHQDGWNNYTTRPPSSGNYSYDRDRSSSNGSYRAGGDRDRTASTSKSQGTNGYRARQQNPDLSGADFREANLREKDFSGRNLSSADLSGADLQDTFLHRVNLNRANLSKANLFRANLLQANLSHANLRGANLIGADLSGADLSGADLSGAKVSVGDRIMVKLTGTILQGTIMPDGTINT